MGFPLVGARAPRSPVVFNSEPLRALGATPKLEISKGLVGQLGALLSTPDGGRQGRLELKDPSLQRTFVHDFVDGRVGLKEALPTAEEVASATQGVLTAGVKDGVFTARVTTPDGRAATFQVFDPSSRPNRSLNLSASTTALPNGHSLVTLTGRNRLVDSFGSETEPQALRLVLDKYRALVAIEVEDSDNCFKFTP